MKRALIPAAITAVTAVLWHQYRQSSDTTPPREPADLKPGWTAAANTDDAAVFRRAFWRKPGADDHILHAERIEWSDPKDGVAKWQWFLVVEPGKALHDWLYRGNPFSLQNVPGYAAETDSRDTRRPAWFPDSAHGKDCEIRRAGNMTLIFCHSDNKLYATDSGNGLTPGVAAR